ncbi:hypothetical protein BDM02DRAFT_347167 [Thelephora ganbajun]|uniref:Uncharacterized protein n=1 Tax=Thelephora ganbajun TaxID=370292 RepID=A0ACB6ZR31_THEGA|nr:hypothetical protein BDM02DRAFT_347167 [Thelephora ganbajun]
MSFVPGPSASRGGIIVQPTYFTSSLYVDSCREDIETLVQEFSQKCHENPIHSFSLFKSIWISSGWQWMHFKVFDAYARDAFLRVTIRLFIERLRSSESVLTRVGALYGVYVFYSTQPCTSAPGLHAVSGIEVPSDMLQSLLVLPSLLDTEQLSPLGPQVTNVLSQLVSSDAFYILPSSDLELYKLPREIFVPDREEDAVTAKTLPTARKRGRPSRRDKQKRANQAAAALETWLLQGACPAPDTSELHDDHDRVPVSISASRDAYMVQKRVMLDVLGRGESGREALRVANEAVLRRLREIDEMAASQGLEVGGEGGEKTGLARIEKVVGGMEEGSSGILGMVGDFFEAR